MDFGLAEGRGVDEIRRLLDARDPEKDHAALVTFAALAAEDKPIPLDVQEDAAWYALRLTPHDGQIASRLSNLALQQGRPVDPDLEVGGLKLILQDDPANGSAAAALVNSLVRRGAEVPADVASLALDHYLAAETYPAGAFRFLVGRLPAGRAPWPDIRDRLLAWGREPAHGGEPLVELVECLRLAGRPLADLGSLEPARLIDVHHRLQDRGRVSPPDLEMLALHAALAKDPQDGAAAARMVRLLLDLGRPAPWALESLALRHHLAQDPANGELAATMTMRAVRHGEDVPAEVAHTALIHFLGRDGYSRGVFTFLVGKLGDRPAPWAQLRDRLLVWSRDPVTGDEAFAELLECLGIVDKPLSDLGEIVTDRLLRGHELLAREGRISPAELEILALRTALQRNPEDSAKAARLAALLSHNGERAPWSVERAALEHYLERDPDDGAVAETLALALIRHGEAPDAALAIRTIDHLAAAESYEPGSIPFIVTHMEPDQRQAVAAHAAEVVRERLRRPDTVDDAIFDAGLLADAQGLSLGAFLGDEADVPEALRATGSVRPIDQDWRVFEAERDIAREHVAESVIDYLNLPLPAPPTLRPNLKARLHGRHLADASGLPIGDCIAFAAAILERRPGDTVADLLPILASQPIQPGPAYAHELSAEDLLHFFHDSWERGRRARDLGYPVIPHFSIMKSASSYASSVLARAWNVPAGVVSVDHTPGFPAWMRFAAQYPIALHDHTIPSDDGMEIYRQAGVSRFVLQVRDPRQWVLSLAHHLIDSPTRSANSELSALHQDQGFEAMMDRLIETFGVAYSDWAKLWRRHRRRGATLGFFKHETLAADPHRFFDEMLQFMEAPGVLHDQIHAALDGANLERSEGGLNYRSGQTEEWRSVLTKRQVERLSELCGAALRGVYDL